jgi:hypothetical protein
MKTFKEHLITEGLTTAARGMEEKIVKGLNNESSAPTAIKNIVKFLKQNNISGKGRLPLSNYPTDPNKWDKYFPGGKVGGSTKTPKTDIIVEGKKTYTISLKVGPAQLTSGGRGEAAALLYNALEKTGKKPDKIVQSLADGIQKLAPSSVAKVKGTIGEVIKSKKDEIISKADQLNHKLKAQMRELFSTAGPVAKAFTEEAISGKIKFMNNEGAANYILVTDFSGTNNQLHRTTDSGYVSKITAQVKPDVRFKSMSEKTSKGKTGYYRYYGVVGLITEEVNNEMNLLTEQLELQNLLQEGVFDWVSEKGKSALEVITKTIEKIKNKIIEYFTVAIQWMKQSWQNVLEFFDLDIDVIYNDKVVW